MVKQDAEVIKEFNDLVNMSASELEKWLKSSDSISSGWKNGESGETVGHNSGTKIVDILKRNPDKKKDKYTEEDIKHMRKVVSYNKRHLAQERHLKEKKGEEELKKTKSYKSLKSEYPCPECSRDVLSFFSFRFDGGLEFSVEDESCPREGCGRTGIVSRLACLLCSSIWNLLHWSALKLPKTQSGSLKSARYEGQTCCLQQNSSSTTNRNHQPTHAHIAQPPKPLSKIRILTPPTAPPSNTCR